MPDTFWAFETPLIGSKTGNMSAALFQKQPISCVITAHGENHQRISFLQPAHKTVGVRLTISNSNTEHEGAS